MLLMMLVMFTATSPLVKHKRFEIFFYSHQICWIFYILLFFHSYGCFVKSSIDGTCKGYNSNNFTIPVYLIAVLDRIVRIWRSREKTFVSEVILHPGNVIEMRFEKLTMNYNPGQYLYLNIPEISKFQWHPYTITSAPHEGFISVHVKVVGDWTKSLSDIVKNSIPIEKNVFRRALVDGPYGAPVQDLFDYRVSLLISAGIGSTPASGILKSVYHAYKRRAPMMLKTLYFIWICRDLQDLYWFHKELQNIENCVFIKCSIYITGNIAISDIHNIILNERFESPVAELGHCIFYGRPKWQIIFSAIKNTTMPTRTKVGVFFCGPSSLKSEIENQIRVCSTYQTEFQLRCEKF
jgi:NADPH oxidase